MSRLKFKRGQDFLPIQKICMFEKVLIKTEGAISGTTLPHDKTMVHFCCHGNRCVNLTFPKSFLSIPTMLNMTSLWR